MRIRPSADDAGAAPSPSHRSDLKAFLAKGCDYSGRLQFEGTVRIDCRFEGEISSRGVLLVGDGAHVNADIDVGTLVISGTVEGNIHAQTLVEIKAHGVVRGVIRAPELVIERGAVLQGSVEMEDGAGSGRKNAGGGVAVPGSGRG